MPMPWSLITLLLLGLGLFHGTGAAREENLLSAQVVGTVHCSPCFNRGFSRTSHFISGASVLLECTDLGFRKEVTTDEHGNFEVRLPTSMSEDAKKIQGCTVKLIKSSNPGCDAVSSRASLRLKLNTQEPQVLSVGALAFTPREQPSSCAPKPTRRGLVESDSKKGSINPESTTINPESTTLPPYFYSPLPPFPPLPPLPPLRPLPPFHFPPLPQPPIPSPSLPPSASPSPFFPFPLPPLPPHPPLPPFPFPPTPEVTTPPPSAYFPFPPLRPPPIPSPSLPPSASPPPFFPFPLPPLPPHPPLPPFPFPPTPEVTTPPPSAYFPFPPLPRPPIPSPSLPPSASLPPFFPFPRPPLPPHPPMLPLPPIPAFTPPPPTLSPYF